MDQRKIYRKRCLSDLESKHNSEVFQELPISKIPSTLKQYMDEQGCSATHVRILSKSSESYLKIFTFQYLLLCFCNKNQQQAFNYLQLIYELIERQQFEFMIPKSPHELSYQSQISLKNILSQYLNFMSEAKENVITSLNKYPMIVDIMVSFFKTMLYLGDVCDLQSEQSNEPLSKEQILQFLTSYFEVQTLATKQIIYFKDSEVSIYEVPTNNTTQSSQFVYIIYQQPIYKIDDSKFSEMLNKQQQAAYRSGISSVKRLISNIDIKSSNELGRVDGKKNQNEGLICEKQVTKQIESLEQIVLEQIKTNRQSLQDGQKYEGQLNRNNETIHRKSSQQQRQIRMIGPAITQQSQQVYSEQDIPNKRKVKKYIENLVNLDAKDISYSYNEDSGVLKGGQDKNKVKYPINYAQKQRSWFAKEKENQIPKNSKNWKTEEPGQPTENRMHFRFLEAQSQICLPKQPKFQVSEMKDNMKTEPTQKISTVKKQKNHQILPRSGKSSQLIICAANRQPTSIPQTKIKWQANQNISKQFTSSFLLKQISQPCRTAIKMCKGRARENRKNARAFFI